MVIEPESILKSLLGFPGTGRYWVAYSGGLDSHVLLHLMASLRNRLEEGELRAVHVNHGLLPEALEWEVHCQQVCRELEIPCEILRVKAGPAGGEGPEAAARQARYTAIGKLMARDDVILTAHHQDDQAETLLLHLVRGSGPHGLAAMPSVRRFLPGWLGRPLLGYPRAALRLYGESHLLDWIDDPSNREDRYERNFLRNEILPAMKTRRPDLIGVLSRVASHQAEAICLMDELAKIDHAAVLGPAKDRLRVSGLRLLSPERRRNVIRYWIRGLGLPLPATTHLHHVLSDVIDAAGDGVPVVSWSGAEVRRYRDLIYAMHPLGRRGEKKIVRWRMVEPLVLGHGSLVAEPVTGQGVSQAVCATGVVSVCYRSGGERCRQSGRGCHHTLKKLFQEYGVPTWERGWIPLVHIDNELAAVADLWICEPFQAREEEAGWRLHWSGENRYRSE